MRTIGAPREGDPRDGELHQALSLEDEWDLEPWDDDPDGEDAHYVRAPGDPEIDEPGRVIWRYIYQPPS